MDFIELRQEQLDTERRIADEKRSAGALVWPPIFCAACYCAVFGYAFALINWQYETIAATYAVLFAAGGLWVARRILR